MLTPHRVRLTDEDRAEYGGPEWIDIDPARFADHRVSVLRNWEDQTGLKILNLVSRDWVFRRDIIEFTAVVWMFRQMAGCAEKYDDFDPHLLAATMQPLATGVGADDADPPSPSSAVTLAEDKAVKPSRSKHGSGK